MPQDLSAVSDPRFILLAWGAGLALAVGYVSLVRIVGAGFTWLATGTSALVSLAAAVGEGAIWARIGIVAVVGGAILARKKGLAGLLLLVGAVSLLVEAARLGGLLPAITAAGALGGVSGEMLLGHWYLIDPRLPRWALRVLALAGIGGLALDGILLGLSGFLPDGGGTIAFWLLLGTSIVLMVAVVASLRYPAYSGVMAATGLSYLAVLTTLGAVFLGRALISGLGPFS